MTTPFRCHRRRAARPKQVGAACPARTNLALGGDHSAASRLSQARRVALEPPRAPWRGRPPPGRTPPRVGRSRCSWVRGPPLQVAPAPTRATRDRSPRRRYGPHVSTKPSSQREAPGRVSTSPRLLGAWLRANAGRRSHHRARRSSRRSGGPLDLSKGCSRRRSRRPARQPLKRRNGAHEGGVNGRRGMVSTLRRRWDLPSPLPAICRRCGPAGG